MNKIIVANIMSLDGYFEGPDKNVMVLPMDGAFDTFNLEHIKKAGTILLGSASYKLFSSFWPQMASNPEANATHHEFATLYNALPKVVVSDTLTKADLPEVWSETTRIVKRADTQSLIDLKDKGDDDIVVFGSHVLWNNLLRAGFVDELHFVVGNVVLGSGTPLFDKAIQYDDPETGLELIEVKTLSGTHNFSVCYKVVKK